MSRPSPRWSSGVASVEPLESRRLLSTTTSVVHGLTGQYFAGTSLANLKLTRVDSTVAFDWRAGSPAGAVPVDFFSARWTGQVQPQYSENYTFYTTADDGVRLWVNNRLVIDDWQSHALRTHSGTIALAANQRYSIKLEYFEATGLAGVWLRWSSAHTPLQTVPSSALYTATAAPAPASAPPPAPEVLVFPRPIVINHGGTYTGTWRSTNPNTPAVIINTSEPVVIRNSNISGAGDLIANYVPHAKLSVINSRAYGLNPNIYGKQQGRFIDLDGFDWADIENNTIEQTGGIELRNYQGNHTAYNTIFVRKNAAHDINGLASNGAGGYLARTGGEDVQFLQLSNDTQMAGVDIGWNQVVNEPGKSLVEDVISTYLSGGTAALPLRIHDNYIQGAYPANPLSSDFSGGGIMIGDGNPLSSAQTPAYIVAYSNQVVSTTNYGISIAGGHDNSFFSNRIISSGMLSTGQRLPAQNVGGSIWNQHTGAFYNDSAHDNVIGWNGPSGRNDFWHVGGTVYNNSSLPGPITLQTEAAEYALWLAKLRNGGVKLGAV